MLTCRPSAAGAAGFVDVRSVVADAIIDLAIDAEWVPAESLSAEDEDRVGVPQWIDLWSDVDREPADHAAISSRQTGTTRESLLDATQAGGCRTGRPVSDGTIAWLQRE